MLVILCLLLLLFPPPCPVYPKTGPEDSSARGSLAFWVLDGVADARCWQRPALGQRQKRSFLLALLWPWPWPPFSPFFTFHFVSSSSSFSGPVVTSAPTRALCKWFPYKVNFIIIQPLSFPLTPTSKILGNPISLSLKMYVGSSL